MPRCRLVSILLVILLGSLVAGAQDNGTAQPTPPPPVPDELRSPRATMETFLGAFYVEGEPDIGWWVGYLTRGDERYFFATRLNLPTGEQAPARLEVTRRALQRIGKL